MEIDDKKKWTKCKKCGCEAFELYEDHSGPQAKVPLILVCWCCREEEEIDG